MDGKARLERFLSNAWGIARWPLLALLSFGLLVLLTAIVDTAVWQVLELLIIPAVLAVGGWWLNKTQKDTEQKIARERQEQETLDQYFDKMTELLLTHQLREKSENQQEPEVVTIARARTLAVVRNLGPDRKGNIIQFLYESQLIGGNNTVPAVVGLRGANLNAANLQGAYLRGADLHGANLEDANLIAAELQGANLEGADFKGAVLVLAKLQQSYLRFARLQGANLTSAKLIGADLLAANLQGANLQAANLQGAELAGAFLLGAKYDTDTQWPADFDPKEEEVILVDAIPIEETELEPKDIEDD